MPIPGTPNVPRILPLMKSGILSLALLLTCAAGSVRLAAAEKPEAAPAVGSIRPAGKLAKADRAALAKLSFAEALKVAQATLPGKVVKGDLEVEDGNLQYAFEIVGDDKKIGEVEVDAGNGAVIGVDHDDND